MATQAKDICRATSWRVEPGSRRFPLIIAHRGDSGAAPENTLAAFRQAIAVGADGIEMDVRLTKDGQLTVFHDHCPFGGKKVGGPIQRAMALERATRLHV